MIFEQLTLACLAQTSYLIGDPGSGLAAVVDPRRDVEPYLELARERGLRIAHVILTHFHADFVAGHLELAEATGATIHLGARAKPAFPWSPLADRAELQLGPDVRLVALETPGHTPEGLSVLVYDRAASSSEPWAVLTGDTLFVGDVGRPDLMASAGFAAEDLAGMLYDSIHDQLLPLPDATRVYPGHGAGSMCGKNLGSEPWTTIGEQRRSNWALQPLARADFVARLVDGLPPAPAYFAWDARLNREQRPLLNESLASSLRPLGVEEALAAQRAGAQLLDTREPEEFAAGHLAGSVWVGLDGSYATWCGTVLDPRRPIVLVTTPEAQRESAVRLGRIGFDHVLGVLQAGGPGWAGAAPLQTLTRLDPAALQARLAEGAPPRLLDVRTPGERAEGGLEGSLHVPLGQLPQRLSELPAGPWVVYCAGGFRSLVAASVLRAAGRQVEADLEGGISAWEEAGLPIPAQV